jgi:16S rRNA (guanine966-N2)-methyltransferase
MRVIAGKLGGRLFDSPDTGNTHPMGEKPRGAIFNALGDISGLDLIDAYAGSGALGFEAISRGARSVVAIELDKQAYKTIVNNIYKLGLDDSVTVSLSTVKAWAVKHKSERADIVICDPPYDAVLAQEIERLLHNVKQNGVLVLSWPSKLEAPAMPGCGTLSEKEYAGARIVFYRKF